MPDRNFHPNALKQRFPAGTLSRSVEILLLVALLGLGLGLRMLNLTSPPLDFHSTRQLRSAIIARGMYYSNLPEADPQRRQIALLTWASMEKYEPPILEGMVAQAYRVLGGEKVWVARIFSSLFWLIGGMALYALVRRALSLGAGLFALAFYLILPWGVIASRSFQPDPWMVMWVLVAAYCLYRWAEGGLSSWLWTALAGIFSGVAILIKAYAIYPVAGVALCVLLAQLAEEGAFPRSILRLAARPQVWAYAALSGVIPAIYYVGLGDRSTSFASFWIFSFTGLLQEPKFYIRWLGLIRGIMDVMVFFAGILGAFLYPRRGRAVALGLWLGYFLIGLTFPFQIYTHDYYSLLLVPTAAVGLAPIAEGILARVRQQPLLWKAAFAAALLVVLGYYAYVARSQVAVTSSYNSEPYPWQKMGAELPQDGNIIALTHDYGNRLKYYSWRVVSRLWPSQGDLELSEAAGSERIGDFAPYFKEQTAGMDYFLVTLFNDLDNQPALKSMLYEHYPIAKQGDGYVLFDLSHPKP